MIGIYKITNKVNGKIYVGESMDIDRRWNEHKNALNSNSHHSWKLQEDWNKYQENNFEFKILQSFNNHPDVITSKSFLIILENKYINKLNSNIDGYNVEDTYSKVINKEKDVINDIGYKAQYPIFNKVDRILNIMSYVPDEMFNKGYMLGSKFYKMAFNIGCKNNIDLIKSLSKRVGIVSGMYSSKNGGEILNKYLSDFIKIFNGDIYVHMNYRKEIVDYYIDKNFNKEKLNKINDNNCKALENVKTKCDMLDSMLEKIIKNINDLSCDNNKTLSKILDELGLSRTIMKNIKQEFSIDTNIEKEYHCGIYTRLIKTEYGNEYIGLFITDKFKFHLIKYIQENKDIKILSKKARDDMQII